MVNRVLFVFLASLLVECSVDRTIRSLTAEQRAVLAAYQQLPPASSLSIADVGEPGQRLLLCVQVVDKATQQPMRGQFVHFYHASKDGVYSAASPGDESTARLRGSAVSDQEGRIFVKTILPGDFGDLEDNRHIHAEVEGAMPKGYDVHFTQYSAPMIKNFIDQSDEHFLVDLCKTTDGTLITFVHIEARYPAEISAY